MHSPAIKCLEQHARARAALNRASVAEAAPRPAQKLNPGKKAEVKPSWAARMAHMALRPAGALRCVALRTPLAAVRPALSACRPAALQSSFLGTPALGGLCSPLRGEFLRAQTAWRGMRVKCSPLLS